LTIFELHRRIKGLDIEVLKEIAVEMNTDLIVKLQNIQLEQSKTSKGTPILPKYSEAYAIKKGFDDPDLFLTGKWRSEIEMIIESGEFDIVSFDEKSQWLVTRYENLLGLNQNSKDTARPFITGTFARLYKNELNLQG
jgi:RecB family endonuclease NucS